MQITSGSEWLSEGGNRRSWSITLDENDGRALNGVKWDGMDWNGRKDWLSKRADLEVLAYMVKEHAITKEFAQQRAKEIKAR